MENDKEVEITQLRKNGMSLMDIATTLDIPIDVVANKLHAEGAIGTSAEYLDSEENKKHVIQLRSTGLTLGSIAKSVGVEKSIIARFLRKASHQDWWAANDETVVKTKTKAKEAVKKVSKKTTPKTKKQTASGKKLSLANDSTKELVKELKAEGLSLNEISDRTGVGYHNVRNFLLKKTYQDWWKNDRPNVDDNYRGLTTEENKLLAISMSTLNNASNATIAKKIDVNVKAIEKFLAKKTYTAWWEKHEAKLAAKAKEAEAAVDNLLEAAAGSVIAEVEQEIEEEVGATLKSSAKMAAAGVGGALLVAALVALAVFIV